MPITPSTIENYRLVYRLDLLISDMNTLIAAKDTWSPELLLAITQAEYALLHLRRYEIEMDPGGIEIRGLDT